MLTKASWRNKYMNESYMQKINKILLARAWLGVFIIDIVWCVQNIEPESKETQTDETREPDTISPGDSNSETQDPEDG